MNEDLKNFWLKRYREDKIGTIAKLSQAMQHMAWLREWRRVHCDEPRIKPITKKENGEKIKIGEADIAVPWSQLPEFFREGNEYGDIETVKFLSELIESGNTEPLTPEQMHDLSERENVKWSDGKHSLNPFQGYLYDFTDPRGFIINLALGDEEYGKFYPISDYIYFGRPTGFFDECGGRYEEAEKAFSRFYATRLLQEILAKQKDSKYYDFVNFDITSVTTPEQIDELDKEIVEIINSPEVMKVLEEINGDATFEKEFYERLREEIEIEIKKDSDRIENAHKVFVALETGNLDELALDQETRSWMEEVYSAERPKITPRDIAEADASLLVKSETEEEKQPEDDKANDDEPGSSEPGDDEDSLGEI